MVSAMNNQARRKVLLVDDEWPVRAFIANALQREGFEVLEAVDGLDAFGVLQQVDGAVDVLVTDVRMPRMTGIELVEKVKTAFPGIPVVYISGECLHDQLHNPSARVVFLKKPFGPHALVQAVRSVCNRAGAARVNSAGN